MYQEGGRLPFPSVWPHACIMTLAPGPLLRLPYVHVANGPAAHVAQLIYTTTAATAMTPAVSLPAHLILPFELRAPFMRKSLDIGCHKDSVF